MVDVLEDRFGNNRYRPMRKLVLAKPAPLKT
jgi:hypothetical protein